MFYLPEECAFLTLASTTVLVVLHLNTIILCALLFIETLLQCKVLLLPIFDSDCCGP